MGERLHKKVANNSKDYVLTPSEKDILHLLVDEFLTVKQITSRRKCSHQNVYKIMRSLRKKGALGEGLHMVAQIQGTMQPKASKVRLHGQEFNIKILWQDEKYQQIFGRSNIIFLDGNTIRLYRNSLEVYSGQSFFADDERQADRLSIAYWKAFLTRLEHDLKIILVKPRSANVREVKHEYARTNSEVSEHAIDNHEQIRVFAEEDGKLAFITDDSFGFKEDETVHPETAKPDRRAIDKQVNDWRLRNPPTNSQLATSIMEVTKNQMQFSQSMQYLDNNLKTHFEVLEGIKEAVKELREEVKKFHG